MLKQKIVIINFLSSGLLLLVSLFLNLHSNGPSDSFANSEEFLETDFDALLSRYTNEKRIHHNLHFRRFSNFIDSSSIEVKKSFKHETQDKILLLLENDDTVLYDFEKGRIAKESHRPIGIKSAQKFQTTGKIWKNLKLKDHMSSLEPLLRNSFDVWNENLDGEIILIPPTDEHKHLSKYGLVYFNINGQEHSYYFVNDEFYTGYINENKRKEIDEFYKCPVKYSIISSRYNRERLHPVKKVLQPHFGTDYAGLEGDPVFSIAQGKVIKLGYDGGNGNYIKIEHDEQYASQYLHLKSVRPDIKFNDKIDKGQIIGYMGSTGTSTAPHVCFRFWDNNRQVDHISRIPRIKKKQKAVQSADYTDSIQYYENQLKKLRDEM